MQSPHSLEVEVQTPVIGGTCSFWMLMPEGQVPTYESCTRIHADVDPVSGP
jgi:hypothetical protein